MEKYYIYTLNLRKIVILIRKRMLKNTKSKPKITKKTPNAKNNFYSEVEISLKNELGRRVDIKSKGKGKGTITLEFYSDEELADFAKKLVGE